MGIAALVYVGIGMAFAARQVCLGLRSGRTLTAEIVPAAITMFAPSIGVGSWEADRPLPPGAQRALRRHVVLTWMALVHSLFWLVFATFVVGSLLSSDDAPAHDPVQADHPIAELGMQMTIAGAELVGGLVALLLASLTLVPAALLSILLPLALRGPRLPYASLRGR